MGNSLRLQPMPSRFGTLQTHVTEDVLQVGLLYAFAIIAASFIAIIPGIRGWEVRYMLWCAIQDPSQVGIATRSVKSSDFFRFITVLISHALCGL